MLSQIVGGWGGGVRDPVGAAGDPNREVFGLTLTAIRNDSMVSLTDELSSDSSWIIRKSMPPGKNLGRGSFHPGTSGRPAQHGVSMGSTEITGRSGRSRPF